MTWRRAGALIACVLAASAAGYGVSPVAASLRRIAALNLTTSERYAAIADVNGRIIVYSRASPSPEYPSTSSTCSSAFVNPSTLTLSNRRSGSCADPAIFGRAVIPAVSIDRKLRAASGGPSAIVRIAHATSVSPGYALGPVVMTFPALAYEQTEPSWIYGGGDLWLYDWVNQFDLLRVSATTGAVLQRLVVPKIQTPLLAFNDDGLWIAPYGESSGALYRLPPRATKVSAVFDFRSGGFAWWLVASGKSVWLDAQPRPVTRASMIWELQGANATPGWHVPASPILRSESEGVTTQSGLVVGNYADGLWTVASRASGAQQVIRIDPSTAKLEIEATLTPQAVGLSSGLQPLQAVTLGGSLFLLDQPREANWFSALYRITPTGS